MFVNIVAIKKAATGKNATELIDIKIEIIISKIKNNFDIMVLAFGL